MLRAVIGSQGAPSLGLTYLISYSVANLPGICQCAIVETMNGDAALVAEIANDPFGAADVVPMRLGEAVIERITQAIHDGRLKPGDALPSEAQIAASFGVSKPIAREAIRQLAAMGVVHIQQGKPRGCGARRRPARPLLPLRGARQQDRPDRGGRDAPPAGAADRALLRRAPLDRRCRAPRRDSRAHGGSAAATCRAGSRPISISTRPSPRCRATGCSPADARACGR